jgi:uncharacterized protein YjeT (DUF2065 family)
LIETVILGIAMVFVLEGLVYALAPSLVEQWLEQLRMLTLEQRRSLGLIAMALGLLLIWATGVVTG